MGFFDDGGCGQAPGYVVAAGLGLGFFNCDRNCSARPAADHEGTGAGAGAGGPGFLIIVKVGFSQRKEGIPGR